MIAHQQGSFAGKVAFVTGAAGGIGRAAALAFAREGDRVAVADVANQDNQGTARLIAAAVMWLCSEAASFVTGAALVVDGGQTV